MSVARFYNFNVNDNQILSVKGLGYINNANLGVSDTKEFKLLLVNQDDSSVVPYIYNLTPTTGDFNPSLGNNDYSYSWFNETSIDLSSVLAGNYKVLLYIKSNSIEDIVELRDFSFKGDITIENTTRIYNLKLKSERRNYDLIVSNKTVTTP